MGMKHNHKHKSKVSDNKVLRIICGHRKGEVIAILDITQQQNSWYRSPNTVMVVKTRRLQWKEKLVEKQPLQHTGERRLLRIKFWGWKVDVAGSGSFLMVGFSINGDEYTYSATTVSVDSVQIIIIITMIKSCLGSNLN
jgi:hypothetical protein